MTVKKIRAKNLVLNYLKEHEIQASASKVGVNFEYEGWNFLLWHDAEDPAFFRLTLPGIFDVSDENYAQALMTCNMLNWKYKVVKASLYEFEDKGRNQASVWVCYEQYLDADTDASALLPYAMQALMEAAEQFLNELKIEN